MKDWQKQPQDYGWLILSLQELQSEPRNEDLVQLKDMERQLQDTLQQWKDDVTAHDNQFIEYEKNITEQIEAKNGQIEDLQSTLKRVQESSELTRYRAVEAERQKWETREARLVSQLDKAMEQIVTLQQSTVLTPICEGVNVTKQQQPRMVMSEIEKLLSHTSSVSQVSSHTQLTSSLPAVSHTSLTQLTSSTPPPVVSQPPVTQLTLTTSNGPESPAVYDSKLPAEGNTTTPQDTLASHSKDCISLYSLINQLPPLSRFSGEEQPDGETFQDWLEQF